MKTFNNPILKGFYPDPSICRVGEDYYLVNSTFTYFPAVPIFHSKDLVHWSQIGNVLDRESQVPLKEGGHSMGIFAPTIRYHQGLFYMITTNVCNGGNFIVTAENPEGPWSEPYFLESDGIDPSLFFDDDGKCYYCGTKDRREGGRYFGDNEIYIQELNLKTMKLCGDSYPAWHGAAKDTIWAEGPHIYKKDDWYYLMISEGGTGHDHAVTISRSKSLFEPFTSYLSNPILTHRHLGLNYPIFNVGHADFVETQNGEWWMVLLASRPYGGHYKNMGRETFLMPIEWEDGWPVVNPGIGKVEMQVKLPDLPYCEPSKPEEKEEFNDAELPMHFMHLRNPIMDNYSLSERRGFLRMKLTSVQLYELESPSFVCRRQQAMRYTTEVRMDFNPCESDRAGICLYQSNEYYYSLYLTCLKEKNFVEIVRCKVGKEEVIASEEVALGTLSYDLKIHANGQDLSFLYKASDGKDYQLLAEKVDGRMLSTDVAGGFVGTCIGIFGCTQEKKSNNYVDFDWFKYIDFEG